MSLTPDEIEKLPTIEDVELVTRVQQGDRAAFELLVRRHGRELLALARRYMRVEDSAREVVQEAFLLAFRAAHTFRGESTPMTWLRHITINAALMRLRRERNHREVSLGDLMPEFDDRGYRKGAQRKLEISDTQSEERIGEVREVIALLPDTYREIVLLRDIAGVDVKDTAELLRVSSAVVHTRLHRARQALRELYLRRFGEDAQR